MNKGYHSAPLLMASLFSAKVLVEYEANFVSDFDPGATYGGETKFLLLFWGT
jgi:hypothetical protein